MAHCKSAIKRLRTSNQANGRNRARNSEIKTLEKRLRAAVAEGDNATALELAKLCASRVDKAAKAGTIHVNKAANKKSQFDKLIGAMAK